VDTGPTMASTIGDPTVITSIIAAGMVHTGICPEDGFSIDVPSKDACPNRPDLSGGQPYFVDPRLTGGWGGLKKNPRSVSAQSSRPPLRRCGSWPGVVTRREAELI
jgi:hypothetical protein